jgi:hypothetical protein
VAVRPYTLTVKLDRQLVHGTAVALACCLGAGYVWARHGAGWPDALAACLFVAVVTRMTDWLEWRRP